MSYRPFTANLYSRNEVGVSTSIAAVARAFAVNPNVLHGWQREFRHGSGNAFLVPASGDGMKAEWRDWNARLVSRPWRSIF